MSKNLVIVESPAKAKTIKKYLGPDYEVLASYGHVRDLVAKEGAVDPEQGFAMRYQVIERNDKHVKAIAKALKDADNLLLATDPDREGEAIAWHLYELLNEKNALKNKTAVRVVFHEITKGAIAEAVAHPRSISGELVDAQQARRALDHLVGFNLSPLLWRKVSPGLSAGRVQSPALRLICEREDEIEKFVAQEYWTLEAEAAKQGNASQPFTARLVQFDGEKVEQFSFTGESRAREVEATLRDAANGALRVAGIDKKQRRRNPAAPFITSTLQQEASRKLGFTTRRSMSTAQSLYEGVDIGGETVGLITYMRTDSVVLAKEAVDELRAVIGERYGKEAVPDSPREYKTKSKNAQEAHEAIRPTSARHHPDDVRQYLSQDQARLYELIWKRTVASQMVSAVFDTVTLTLNPPGNEAHALRANGSTLVVPGFIAVYQEGRDDVQDDDDTRLPPVEEGEELTLLDLHADQHFTEPPPRYTEASLVKTLEEFGIGRPSTYASIISTLLNREYVELESKRFTPTDVGRIVNRFLTDHFSQYVDYDFTARLEDELDAISRGEKKWIPVLEEFWGPFKERLDEKAELSREQVAQAREIGIDPQSGKPVTVRLGRFGPFVQIGTKDDADKPRFAGLRPGQSMQHITLDEALELFNLPRDLGATPDGEEMQANVGRFGPYIRYGKKFVSLKEPDDPYTVTPERALEIVADKKQADAERIIQVFDGSDIQVLNGRYGPYITDGKKNAKIPKEREPQSLTLAECEELIAAAPERKGRGRKAPAKKPAAKKSAAKKPAAKKAAKT